MYYLDLSKPLKNRIHFDNQNEMAKKIGITASTLSRILNARIGTTKMTAYCIVKMFDKEAEIEDYFVREED